MSVPLGMPPYFRPSAPFQSSTVLTPSLTSAAAVHTWSLVGARLNCPSWKLPQSLSRLFKMGTVGSSGVPGSVCTVVMPFKPWAIWFFDCSHTQSCLFWIRHLTPGRVWCAPFSLFCVSLITEGVEHHSWNTLTVYTFPLLQCLIQSATHFKNRAICFIIKWKGSL